MTLDESIQGLRVRVMRRAEQIGNVSQVCTEFGISRTRFYRWRRRFEPYGPDGLHPRRTQGRRGRPRQVAPETERLVQSVAISAGTWAVAGSPAIWPAHDSSTWPPARSSGSSAESA
jgi:transposase